MLKDADEVEYELAVSEDEKIYRLVVRSKKPISNEEYAACLRSLSKDIFEGKLVDILNDETSPLN